MTGILPADWDDAALAARCAARDEEAWRELLKRHGGALHAILRRMFLSARIPAPDQEAREALGELAAALLAHDAALLKTYRPSSDLRVYLSVVARSVAMRMLKRRHALSPEDLVSRVPQSVESLPGDPERLEQALAALPPRERLLLRLVYWDGFSYARAAAAAGLAPGSVGQTLTRAREKIRQFLSRTAGPGSTSHG